MKKYSAIPRINPVRQVLRILQLRESVIPNIRNQKYIMTNLVKSTAKFTVLAGLASSILATGALGQAATSAPVPFKALLPHSVTIAESFDTPYWWAALADVRQIPDVHKAIMRLESNGFSLNRDVFSWAGQLGFVLASPPAARGSTVPMAFLIQIKDQAAFDAALPKLISDMGLTGKAAPKRTAYRGATIYSNPKPARKGSTRPPTPEFAQTHGWFIIGMGTNAVKNEIDLANGIGAPLATNSQWAEALATVGPLDQNWVALDYGTYAKAMSSMNKNLGNRVPAIEPSVYAPLQLIMIVKIAPSATSFEARGKLYPTTDVGASLLKSLVASPTPDTSFIRSIPDATGITILRSASSCWNFAREVSKPTAIGGEKSWVEKMTAQRMNMISGIVAQFTGPVAFVLTSKPGHGLGLVMLAQANSHEAAESTAGTIADLFNSSHVPTDQNGETWTLSTARVNGKLSPLASLSAMGAMFGEDVNPEIEVDGTLLKITSSPTWTHEVNADSTLEVPAFTADTFLVTAGNFKFLEPIEGWVAMAEAHAADGTKPQYSELLTGLKLDNATCQYVQSIDPKTGVITNVASVNNWDWKAALTNTAAFITGAVKHVMSARPPHATGHVAPKHAAPKHKFARKLKHAVVKHHAR